jgi:predicted AAA+ superfamily ATPase
LCNIQIKLEIYTESDKIFYVIEREIAVEFRQAMSEFKSVTILGPRQSGKTTLARTVFSQKEYVSLEDPDIRLQAEADPRQFLKRYKDGAIFDEIQRLPNLLSFLQTIMDSSFKKGMYVFTGSHQPLLHEAISQSLAGRTAILNLWPFTIAEIRNYKKQLDPFELILQGSYPAIYEEKLDCLRFYRSYLETYVQRDVRTIAQLHSMSLFQKFLILLAGRTGQILNYSSISNDLGISSTTVKSWLSILEASFIVFQLQPFFMNIKKRLIRSPKVYFTDVGLATYLLGIKSVDQVERDPLRGGLYENLIVSEIIKNAYNKGIKPEVYFYRDSHGNEVDLLIRNDGKLIPIEIKSASTFTKEFLKSSNKLLNLDLRFSDRNFILLNCDEEIEIHNTTMFNPLKCDNLWDKLIATG